MNPILEFTVKNNKSINEACTLSLIATAISDEPTENILHLEQNKILKSAVIYGANSSGKSNIVKSLSQMKNIVLSSVKLNDHDELDYKPFLLSNNEDKPSHFEIIFISDNNKYRYGFEFNRTEITEEWLYRSSLSSKTEKELFYREFNTIEYNKTFFKEGENKDTIINSNRLLISLCAQLGGVESKKILTWFREEINVISGIDTENYYSFSKRMLHNQTTGYDKAKEFFSRLQLGFSDIKSNEIEFDINSLPEELSQKTKDKLAKSFNNKKKIQLQSVHNIYNNKGKVTGNQAFPINWESEGTKKLIELSGPIFDTLANGLLLVIDELDAKLHPLISRHIINLFNNEATNNKGAQLIFTTHDTNLLSSQLFRRDQIWFTEKNTQEQTDLYNIMDILLPDGNKPRNDSNYAKNYIAGRYGAIPFITNK